MPYILQLPAVLRMQGWQVKIRDRERLEVPHVTLIRRSRTWRFDLRAHRFLDTSPPVREVPLALRTFVLAHMDALCDAWDKLYPDNPIGD